MQRLWSLISLQLEDEEDVVIPWRVRDLADAFLHIAFVFTEIDLDGILVISASCRRCEQPHTAASLRRLACLLWKHLESRSDKDFNSIPFDSILFYSILVDFMCLTLLPSSRSV